MGSVWRGEHLLLGTEVAVKLMSKQWATMPSARTRFLREARMTAAIQSPHVVRVLDCRLTGGDEPFIVLELLAGENLEERVARHGSLSVFEVAEIVGQTCEALAATHAAEIIHRDVKPENVFLVAGSHTPLVKLLDLGVAKPKRLSECMDADLLPAGTPRYMSPEQMFESEKTDERSDLFSLAAVAYFALTRRSPFEAASLEGLYFAIDGADFVRPSVLRPELPHAIDAWFEKALAREPDRRFQTAREMSAALYDVVRDGGEGRATLTDVQALPASGTEAPSGETPLAIEADAVSILPRRRRPHIAAAAGLAALAAASVLVASGDGASVPTANASSTSAQLDLAPDGGETEDAELEDVELEAEAEAEED